MRITRPFWLAGGLTAVALGVVGAFLPIMPTVPFLLLAAFCFSRSHPVWEQRLLDHPKYGPSLRDWRERRAIGRRAKVLAIASMAVGAVVVWFTIGWPWVLISLAIVAISGTWIWTRAE